VHFICIPKAHTYISRNTFVVIPSISQISKKNGETLLFTLHRAKERKKKEKQNASLLGRCLPDV
jgi:hypothetical protein